MKSLCKIFALLLGASGLLGNFAVCATDETPPRIIFLGDSITAGYGVAQEEAYPALIQNRLKEKNLPHQVVNAGISGDTTSGGLRRVEWALAQGADVLVIALGGNDGLRGVPTAQTEENLRNIINKARRKSPDIKIILAGMRMPDSMGKTFTEAFAAIFPKVAKETNVTLVPFLLEGVGGDPAMNQADMIHPNPEGQKRVAATLLPIVLSVIE